MALENFFNKVSALAYTGFNKGKELAVEGAAKAKEFTEIGKLKVENATEQEAIKKAYAEIGQIYFAAHAADPEEPYAALCEKILASKAKIEYNLDRIADIKAAGNVQDEDIEAACEAEAEVVEAETVVEETPVAEAPIAETVVEETPVGEAPVEVAPKAKKAKKSNCDWICTVCGERYDTIKILKQLNDE